MNENEKFSDYFHSRMISADSYSSYQLPRHLIKILPEDKESHILDFGCGFGQITEALIKEGYRNVSGYDIEPSAIDYCVANKIPIIDSREFLRNTSDKKKKFDFIIISHVLEHIHKTKIIDTLEILRELLSDNGKIYIAVPNAQSSTNCYWAYEDFTHETLFTGGSLYYVLSKSGFRKISFLDIDCTENVSHLKKIFRRIFLFLYRANYHFWNEVTGSAVHAPSPEIFSYEIKAIAWR